jgi:DNA polymerase-3 subunit chi
MAEVLFYHLQRQPLESALPTLLGKSLERGWRALVRAGSAERLASLDDHLWSYAEDSFLPHGTASEADAADQPVLLTLADENLNGADVMFVVDGAAMPADCAAFRRVVVMFDGANGEVLAAARATWRDVTGAGHDATYWQQTEGGGWERKR